MPILWESKVILAKIETIYGTDPVPTGPANAILATQVKFTPMAGQDVSRDLEQPYFGADPMIPTDLHAILEFDVEMQAASAAGTEPAWSPLVRMCGVARVINAGVSVVYNPITNSPDAGALWINIGGTQYKLPGARGNVSFEFNASGIPYLKFRFMGLFTPPADGAAQVPDTEVRLRSVDDAQAADVVWCDGLAVLNWPLTSTTTGRWSLSYWLEMVSPKGFDGEAVLLAAARPLALMYAWISRLSGEVAPLSSWQVIQKLSMVEWFG